MRNSTEERAPLILDETTARYPARIGLWDDAHNALVRERFQCEVEESVTAARRSRVLMSTHPIYKAMAW